MTDLTQAERNSIERIGDFILSPATRNNAGAFGVVRYAYASNNCYAFKIFSRKLTDKEEQAESNSLKNISQSKNIHIVRWVSFIRDAQYISTSNESRKKTSILVMEGIRGYDLNYYLQQSRFSEQIAWYLFRQLIDGLEAIQKAGYAHRDLKLENLMITVNAQGEPILKIIDFGHSIKIEKDKKYQPDGGSPSINDPCFYNKMLPYNPFKADIFSAGVVLLRMITNSNVFQKAWGFDKVYQLIISGNWQKFWAKVEQYLAKPSRLSSAKIFSPSLKDLLQGLLAVKADTRLSIEQIKQYAWFATNKQPNIISFVNLKDLVQAKYGSRSAQIQIPSQYYEDIPKVDLSALKELCKQDQPDFTVGYGFEELYAKIKWFTDNDETRKYDVGMKQGEGRLTVLLKVTEEKETKEEETKEEEVKEEQQKVEPEIQIQLFKVYNEKKLALYFTRNKQLESMTFYRIQNELKQLL